MPTSSADSQSTSAAMRRRENPIARRAAISPRRWFTDTVSSTVISTMPNDTVTNASAAEICRKYENPTRSKRSITSSFEKA